MWSYSGTKIDAVLVDVLVSASVGGYAAMLQTLPRSEISSSTGRILSGPDAPFEQSGEGDGLGANKKRRKQPSPGNWWKKFHPLPL